ncbi:hypothetical protein GCM10007094_41040 [Pseudovibrio japonicus]|uniref:Secreted protein n=1 Tax=Pseudovibrio japonicus TaxID=366534 RepID=A0ABQ3EQ92_9HYPH|nr:hypothetical protein GCM10007094_41040 [Pseudovibrio japonicus]
MVAKQWVAGSNFFRLLPFELRLTGSAIFYAIWCGSDGIQGSSENAEKAPKTVVCAGSQTQDVVLIPA